MGDYSSRSRRSDDHYLVPRSKERHNSGHDAKRPLFGNLTWNRETEANKDKLAESLLSRIEQGPTSLLERIGLQNVKREPGEEQMGGNEDDMDVEEDMLLGSDDAPHGMPPPTSNDLKLADLLIASALAEATKAAPRTAKDEPVQRVSISESAVSDSSATASADHPQNSTLPAVDASEAQSSGVEGGGGAASKTELIEQAKQLLIPIITQNARLRDPDADAETIRNRVLSIITDEQCLQFLQIARNVREQVRSGGRKASPGDKGTVGPTQTPQLVAASMPENAMSPRQLDGIYDARVHENPVRKQGAPGTVAVLSGESSRLSQPQDEPVSSSSSSSSLDMQVARRTPIAPGSKSPPKAPRAMLRHSHPDFPPPSTPAALRSATSPYGPAYRTRFSPPRAAAITTPVSPRSMRKTSTPRENVNDPTTLILTESAKEAIVQSAIPESADSNMSLASTLSSSSSPVDPPTKASLTEAENESGGKPADGSIHPEVPMVVDEAREASAPAPTTEPPPLPADDNAVAEVKVEQPHAAVEPLSDAQPGDLVPASQTSEVPPNAVVADPAEVEADVDVPTAAPTAEDQFTVPIEPSVDVTEPIQDVPEPVQAPGLHEESSVISEESKEIASAAIPPETESTTLQLPELLYITAGSRMPDVMDISFEVNEALAGATRRWSAGQASYDAEASYASVYLLCLPTAEVRAMYERVGLTASKEDYGNALWSIRTKWPQQGKLMIEINSGESTHCTFVPQQLGPRDGPLEVSKFIQQGKNALRLIHLADSSAHLFVLLAREPLSRELKWHSLVRSFASPPPIVAGPTHTAPTIAAC